MSRQRNTPGCQLRFGVLALVGLLACKDAPVPIAVEAGPPGKDSDRDAQTFGPIQPRKPPVEVVSENDVAPVAGEHALFMQNPVNSRLSVIAIPDAPAPDASAARATSAAGSAALDPTRSSTGRVRALALLPATGSPAGADVALAILERGAAEFSTSLFTRAGEIPGPTAAPLQHAADRLVVSDQALARGDSVVFVVVAYEQGQNQATRLEIELASDGSFREIARNTLRTTAAIENAWIGADGLLVLRTAGGFETLARDAAQSFEIEASARLGHDSLQVLPGEPTAPTLFLGYATGTRDLSTFRCGPDCEGFVEHTCSLPPQMGRPMGDDGDASLDEDSGVESPTVPIVGAALLRSSAGDGMIVALAGDELFVLADEADSTPAASGAPAPHCGAVSRTSLRERDLLLPDESVQLVRGVSHVALVTPQRLITAALDSTAGLGELKTVEGAFFDVQFLPKHGVWFARYLDRSGCAVVRPDGSEVTLLDGAKCSDPMDSERWVLTTTAPPLRTDLARIGTTGSAETLSIETPIWSGLTRADGVAFIVSKTGDIDFVRVDTLEVFSSLSALDISATAEVVFERDH